MTEPASNGTSNRVSNGASCSGTAMEEKPSSPPSEIVIGIDIDTSPCCVSFWNGSHVQIWNINEMMERSCINSNDHGFSTEAALSDENVDTMSNMKSVFRILFGESTNFPFLMHTVDIKIDRLLDLLVEETSQAEKCGHPFPSTIVFVERKTRCDEVAEALVSQGLSAVSLLGGHSQSEREAGLHDIRSSSASILVGRKKQLLHSKRQILLYLRHLGSGVASINIEDKYRFMIIATNTKREGAADSAWGA